MESNLVRLAFKALLHNQFGLYTELRMYGVRKAALRRTLDGGNQKAKEEWKLIGSDFFPLFHRKYYDTVYKKCVEPGS